MYFHTKMLNLVNKIDEREREWWKSDLIQVEGMKVRSKITHLEVVKKDMLIKEIIESMILDKIEWRERIHVNESD